MQGQAQRGLGLGRPSWLSCLVVICVHHPRTGQTGAKNWSPRASHPLSLGTITAFQCRSHFKLISLCMFFKSFLNKTENAECVVSLGEGSMHQGLKLALVLEEEGEGQEVSGCLLQPMHLIAIPAKPSPSPQRLRPSVAGAQKDSPITSRRAPRDGVTGPSSNGVSVAATSLVLWAPRPRSRAQETRRGLPGGAGLVLMTQKRAAGLEAQAGKPSEARACQCPPNASSSN